MCTFKHLRQPLEPLPFFTGFSPSSSQSLQPSHRPPSCYSGSVRMVERAILIFNSYAPFLTPSAIFSHSHFFTALCAKAFGQGRLEKAGDVQSMRFPSSSPANLKARL